jgi:hypothetical protein
VADDAAFRPRRCIWAQPTAGGPLRIRFRGVPVGRVVRGHGLIPWLVGRDARGTPISLAIAVGGERIGTFVYRDGDGWKPFQFETKGHAGRTEEVVFEVTSASVHDRHFCFQADTR